MRPGKATANEQPPFEEDADELFERAPCGYLAMALDGTIARVNGTLLGWLGSSADEVVGRRFAELLSGGGRIYYETHYAPLLMLHGAVREIAFDMRRSDGTLLPILVNASLELDADGAPRMIRAALFDATHRREYERELLRARDDERAARERMERLQDVSRALVATLDPAAIGETVLAGIAALATSGQAIVLRIDEADGSVAPLAWRGAEPSPDAALLDRDARLDLLQAALEHDLAGVLQPDALAGVAAGAWGEGIVIQPCVAEGRVVGALCLGRSPGSALEPPEEALLVAVSEQCALALERARLFDREQGVARSLQRSLLAGGFPDDPRFEIAAFYEAGISDLSVGGDWHDAFTPSPGRLMLVVGDIVGRGLEAASTMGRLRSAVRALAVAGFSPGELLARLDAFAELDEPARMTTLVCVEIELASGRARLASAGHPPVLVMREGEAPELVWEGRSLPLGALGSPMARPETTLELGPGAVLILCTDGLIERRSRPIDSGLGELAEQAALSRQLPRPG